MDGIAKKTCCSKSRCFLIHWSIVSVLRTPLQVLVLTFAALETGLKIVSFFKVTLGILNSTAEANYTDVDGKNNRFDPHCQSHY